MTTRNLGTSWLLAAGLLAAGIASAAEKGETPLTLQSLPAPVQHTARAQLQGATLRGIAKEVEDGKTVYEVSMKVNGLNRDIIIAADGALLVSEDEKPLASLPELIRSAFVKSAGKGKILIIESVTQAGKLAYYEAQVRTGKATSEVKIGLDGQVIPPDPK